MKSAKNIPKGILKVKQLRHPRLAPTKLERADLCNINDNQSEKVSEGQ